MNRPICLLFVFIFSLMQSGAQRNIAGEYYLSGAMEVASGFKLNNDSSFEFFFSYGALDRYGSGKWSVNKDSVVFNSKPFPGSDFKLVNTIASNNASSILKIEDKNTNLYRLVYCRLKSGNRDSVFEFDETGTFILPYAADSIELLCELCAERVSSFSLDTQPATYTFHFEPWMPEVFFNNAAYYFSGEYLEGKHPLLGDKVYRFNKEDK